MSKLEEYEIIFNRQRIINQQNKKHKKNNKIFIIIPAAAAAVIIMGYLFFHFAGFGNAKTVSGNIPAIASVTAETGSILSTVTCSGNLKNPDSVSIKILSGIRVNKVYVESGDKVAKGDTLALLDTNSISANIAAAQNSIKSIDEELEALNEQASDTVDAYISGRVKKIYAGKDDSVTRIIRKHGALLLLSVDGLMALDFESSAALKVGEKVDVELSDGSVVGGTVERVTSGIYTITISDNGPELSETVTVRTKDGTELGHGELYIHQAVSITAAGGIIKSVNVKENEKAEAGNELFTLTETIKSVEFQELLADREHHVEDLKNLLSLEKNPVIKADCSGSIENVNLTEDEATGTSNTNSQTETSDNTGMMALSDTNASLSSSAQTNSEVEAFTIIPDNLMQIDVPVDELDITALELGQEAELAFDALNNTYLGTVTKISDTATPNSGVVSYTVTISIPKEAQMRSGMSVNATIIISEAKDILLVPVAAVQEVGDRSFVYTDADMEQNILSGEADVTTGLSDGNFVEIISGLKPGNEVYYYNLTASTYTETVPATNELYITGITENDQS